LPASLASKERFYARDLPDELLRHLWSRFEDALMPLDSTGRLGVVLFQYPSWFLPGIAQMDYILGCRERLPSYSIAVEFRNNRWLSESNRDTTLGFLRQNGLSFVCVDEPQGFSSSVPPVAEVTAATGVVRFHGRKAETWEKKNATPAERFDYYYTDGELSPWCSRIKECAEVASEVHVLFNTNNGDQGVVNARLMASML